MASGFPPALSVWSRIDSAGTRVRADGYWQAESLTWGRQTAGMPSMKTRRCGTSRAPRACPPTWFAASSHSPGTGGRATTAETSRPGRYLSHRRHSRHRAQRWLTSRDPAPPWALGLEQPLAAVAPSPRRAGLDRPDLAHRWGQSADALERARTAVILSPFGRSPGGRAVLRRGHVADEGSRARGKTKEQHR